MNQVAESYVRLVLAVGVHDDGYVDAYYGPEELRRQVESNAEPLETIGAGATQARAQLESVSLDGLDELERLRHEFLDRQLGALVARIDMLHGKKLRFDEESRALYNAVAPAHSAAHYETILAQLDEQLPGEGSVSERRETFREEFVIPKAKLDSVFRAAIEECRKRIRPWVELPDDEDFRLEYVTDKAWSGYNWFQGGHQSLIQINTDLPIHIDRAIDLACHEGYPGHHAYNVLLEWRLYEERGWSEYCVYPLFSPMSLIAEGSANYGIELTFPDEERIKYESEHLFPLAGIDPNRAELYYEIEKLAEKLNFAGNEAARRYLDGEIGEEGAVEWLQNYALMSEKRARQRVRFIEKYRSYVINYNVGKELVREYIEAAGEAPEARWRRFTALLSSPRLPSGLK
ncbi:MAG: hypothetical protein JSW67_02575 [Candidatus Latescibacterota bacterium]|nr:MAG: hypothetical protein JSW67_02575 [Candidatus Latescibacterota bacterium]